LKEVRGPHSSVGVSLSVFTDKSFLGCIFSGFVKFQVSRNESLEILQAVAGGEIHIVLFFESIFGRGQY
jgi:hypothetical protein